MCVCVCVCVGGGGVSGGGGESNVGAVPRYYMVVGEITYLVL